MTSDETIPDTITDRSLLIVDDDRPFLDRLASAMQRRGFEVRQAATTAEAVAAINAHAPAFLPAEPIAPVRCPRQARHWFC